MPRYRFPYLLPGQRVRLWSPEGEEKTVQVDDHQTVTLTEAEAGQLRAYDLEPVDPMRGKPRAGGFE